MKKILCFGFALVLMFGLLSFPAMAAEAEPICDVTTYTEYCDDGGYFVVEVGTYASKARASSVDGYKTATYYNSDRVAVFDVTVHGTFSYTYNVSAKADSASCTVTRYIAKAEFVSKNAYVSGASAIARGTVKYGTSSISKSVVLTCDNYGKLS